MALNLQPPPQNPALSAEEAQWREALWRRVTGSPDTSGDEAYEIKSSTTYHGVTALTAGRTLTLPPSKKMRDGDEILIQDESGDAGTFTITISAQGSDSILGTATISSDYGRRLVIKRGDGKYYSV